MNEIVYRGDSNQPLTNSKLVAEVFEKEHKHVREAIKKLLTTAENSTVRQMFSESTYLNEQNKESAKAASASQQTLKFSWYDRPRD